MLLDSSNNQSLYQYTPVYKSQDHNVTLNAYFQLSHPAQPLILLISRI